MSAAHYIFRSELRRGGWPFVVATSVLPGLVARLAHLARPAARRTASAFERFELADLLALAPSRRPSC